MLQHATRPPTRGRQATPEAEEAQGVRPDKQSRLGNAAVAGRAGVGQTEGAQAASSISNDELSSWLGGDEEQRPAMARGDGVGPQRPSKVSSGTFGALVGDKDTVELTQSADGTGEKISLPDGSPCKVLEVKGDRVKVEVRQGKDKKSGWALASVFTDQPALNRDDEAPGLKDDFIYAKQKGDHSPVDPKGKDTAQGALGDCYFIASMAAVANASPQSIKEAIKYNKDKETYTVRFYEEQYGGQAKAVYIEVDAYLPTVQGNRNDPAYAGEPGGKLWPAIMEKAYAKWKGGYEAMGNGGYGAKAMGEITGSKSAEKSPRSMKEEEVIPYFEKAKKEGGAIYAAVEHSRKSDVQTPFTGSGDQVSGTVTHGHRWNHIVPGTMKISDKGGKMKGTVTDSGREGDPSSKLSGSAVETGSIDYKKNLADMKFRAGQGPAKPADLELRFDYQGCVNPEKLLVANHAYAFEGVVNGKELQFYNPWGTWQPKPITPAEFLKHFTNISVNKAPSGATKS
ncbi:hypothetical protein LBMAG42_32970 [Deltaproteobacteria bacterium]|nr:hypothetical protein LBMAG42_32970 [Deltaproteobacteria bacterium]